MKKRLLVLICGFLVFFILCFSACSFYPPSILNKSEAHYYGEANEKNPYYKDSPYYIQVMCEFLMPETVRLESIEISYIGVPNAPVYGTGIAFNDEFESISMETDTPENVKNEFGIFIDGVDSKTLSTNIVKKGSVVRAKFKVVKLTYSWIYEKSGGEDWIVTMIAKNMDDTKYTNLTYGEKGEFTTYYLGGISVKDIMINDLKLER